MFFHRYSYENSCFSELAYNSSVFALILWSSAWNSKKLFILKMLLWILCFWFWSYTPSKSLSHFHYGQNSPWASYCSFFCATSAAFLAYVGDVLETSLFSLLLIHRYILAIQQIITHEEHLRYSFWPAAIFWTTSEAFAPWS